ILAALGVQWSRQGDNLDINASHLSHAQAPYELVNQLRASFFVIGPLLARLGVAHVPLPGGCAIGARPVELHLRGLQAMGAEIKIEHNVVYASIKKGKRRLQGAKIHLDCPSVGATETLMMAATLAEGETILENAAQEPEVADLANFCQAMGAQIRGAGTKTLVISGVACLQGTDYRVIPDRIEASTFLIAGAITRSPLCLTAINPNHLTAVIAKLTEIGAEVVSEGPDCLRLIPGKRYKAINLQTSPYPGFPTDVQAQLMALLTLCEGKSTIAETIFENRLQHVAQLNRMGAAIDVKDNRAIIRGVSKLSGVPVVATDLRAGAALVLAALAAEGMTTIEGLHYIDRGYENLAGKLQQLGATLKRQD
ncbi:MAG: UDP-N-acetylglucosamine 1-carboxyvinyltransferase, partial [Microcystaceae cyanobacterium]